MDRICCYICVNSEHFRTIDWCNLFNNHLNVRTCLNQSILKTIKYYKTRALDLNGTLGKTLCRTCRARLEFQPAYPRTSTSACDTRFDPSRNNMQAASLTSKTQRFSNFLMVAATNDIFSYRVD